MSCIKTVSYQVLINGQPWGNIIPKRGLRQGDPLSPFVFILCTEALIALFREAEDRGRISGMRIARASPPVSHLLFADDSLFFCKAEPRECMEVLKILQSYGKASGQCINFDKSSVFFGKKVPGNIKTEIKDTLGIQQEGGMGTYLGIPEDISGSKCKIFAFIKDRLQNRVNGWSSKWLSKGGKEVLIKSVALALPTYVMSSFLLPLDTCEKLTSAIARYWWSSDQDRRGVHWATWEKMCIPKKLGGAGFRAIHEFNLALLAKQLWRLLRYPNSLLARVLRGRYYKYSNPLRNTHDNTPSYGWRSIMAAKPLLTLGIRQKIHSGLNTRMWEDLWIPTNPARPARARVPVVHPLMMVTDFISKETLEWNLEMLNEFVHQEDIPLIKSLAISKTFHRDEFCWQFTKQGHYTVKSGYWAARNLLPSLEDPGCTEPSIRSLQAHAWRIKAPHKIRHLIWQLLSGYIAVTKNLAHRGMRCDDHCPRCGAPEETTNHAIFECPLALQTWALASTPSPPDTFPSASLYTNFDFLFWRKSSIEDPDCDEDPYPWIIWFIWKARNEKLFGGIDRKPPDIIRHAEAECHAWHEANSRGSIQRPIEPTNRPQAVSLRNICLVDGSWHQDSANSGMGWLWIDADGENRLLGARNQPRRLSPLHSEFEALLWAMSNMASRSSHQVFGTDCQDIIKIIDHPKDWPNFSTEHQEFLRLRSMFLSFSIVYIPRAVNVLADRLARLARIRGNPVNFIGCSIPVWLATPPQV